LSDIARPTDIADIVPISCWTSAELPTELREVVRDIARHSSLPLSTRIQNSLDAVARLSKSNTDRLEKELNEEKEKAVSFRNQAETFAKLWKSVMPDLRINFDMILTDCLTQSILADAIRDLRTKADHLDREKVLFKSEMSEIRNALDVGSAIDVKTAVVQLHRLIQKLKKKCKEHKLKSSEVCVALREAESRVNESNNQLAVIEKEKQGLRNQLADLQFELTRREKEVGDLGDQVSRLTLENESLEKDNLHLNGTADGLRKRKQKLEKRLQAIPGMLDEWEETSKKQRQKAQTRYDRLMSRLIELQDSLRDMSEKAATFEAKNTELVIKVQKLDNLVSAVQMESFREKRQIELQFNARVHALESEYRATLKGTKADASAARNAICEAIARQFSGLLDGLPISESPVESALQAVR
jgi:DNA repair exonuclease SbcCD ATPase subunit